MKHFGPGEQPEAQEDEFEELEGEFDEPSSGPHAGATPDDYGEDQVGR